MAGGGAASLSLGRIARAMGVSTPALYRYFASRDALVFELVRDSYAELADVSATAAADLGEASFAERFRGLVGAYRQWALDHSQDYVLIHGAVFPGCAVPDDLIRPELARTLRPFVGLLVDASEAGLLQVPSAYNRPPEAVAQAVGPMASVLEIDAAIVLLAYMTWLPVHALVWEHIRGHSSEMFDPEAFFAMEMEVLLDRLGLSAAPPPPGG
ncbi:MAG: AcrR family transcriptional regulator [Myxococcota bacterium]|jgi:AcrR family transcriptional regulator